MRLDTTHKQRRLEADLRAPILLFLLLAASKAIISEQSNEHRSRSTIELEPKSDYEKTSVDLGEPQTEHEVAASRISSMIANQKEPKESAFSHNDPFALTFEDYLREASKHSVHHITGDMSDDDSSFLSSADAIPTTSSLITEHDERSSAKTKENPIIDYIFPPPRQETSHQGRHETRVVSREIDNIETSSKELFNEIRLLFSWKKLPTNRCSKTCGKGFRLNHLSCVDLKYDVKVEDVLCLKSNLIKPSELSDEPCNEVDCPPQWDSIEFQECNAVPGKPCHPELYKRAQCTMITKTGALVYLEDSKCATNGGSSVTSNHHSNESQNDQPTLLESRPSAFLDEVNADDSSDGDDRNDILPNLEVGSALESLLSKASPNHVPQYEPFYEPGPWSNCTGAPCGQLGSRTRKISCRLHLSRSSKFAELPESRCQNAAVPDTQEPCYMDCGPENISHFNGTDINDETVYDLEMTRFIWRKGGWTKCSVDCLGGQRESIIECWDSEAKVSVEPALCEESSRPQTVVEVCNDIPCTPEWRAGEFSKCTRPCGSAGVRTRNVECVQQVPSLEGPSFLVVSNDLCIQTYGSMPKKSEHCNRIDCKPEWSVGPWSECSKKCGEGVRNRTVICVQEFANRDGPVLGSYHKNSARLPSPDLLEAISVSGKDWVPGQAAQVPFHECYEEYKTIPSLDERCFSFCERGPYIDADVHQEYKMNQLNPPKKKSITLRIGGKAEVSEGQNMRIRCKIVSGKLRDNLVKKQALQQQQVEWRKDGIQIFPNGSKVVDKQYIPEDNSIFSNDMLSDEKHQFMADEPSFKRSMKPILPRNLTRHRNLKVRSWNNYQGTNPEVASQGTFNFVPQRGGRFSLKENTLRIKKLRLDDSGTYTCSYGSLSESIELKVVNRRNSDDTELKILNNLGL